MFYNNKKNWSYLTFSEVRGWVEPKMKRDFDVLRDKLGMNVAP